MKQKQDRTYKKGEILYFTEGSYSDYSVDAVMVVVKDFDFQEVCTAFWKDRMEGYSWKHRDMFVPYLEQLHYIADISNDEIHFDDVVEIKHGLEKQQSERK